MINCIQSFPKKHKSFINNKIQTKINKKIKFYDLKPVK